MGSGPFGKSEGASGCEVIYGWKMTRKCILVENGAH
jgi:hypothetical protein